MAPDAYRTAGLVEVLKELNHTVADYGNLRPKAVEPLIHTNPAIHHLDETVGWALTVEQRAFDAIMEGQFPVFLGGDHSIAIGSIAGIARASAKKGRKQYVLWLDAHPDFHLLETTRSGNLHGTPMAYLTGQSGFEGYYPPLTAPLEPENICMMGIRSVDEAENSRLVASGIQVWDMRLIDEHGVAKPLRAFLEKVRAEEGALHVSFDVDFLEPEIAPAVGTTVPGGASFREAHLIMEMLCDSGLVTSLDLVELNPFLDERGRTAKLMVDLCASLMGRKVLDRPTRSF